MFGCTGYMSLFVRQPRHHHVDICLQPCCVWWSVPTEHPPPTMQHGPHTLEKWRARCPCNATVVRHMAKATVAIQLAFVHLRRTTRLCGICLTITGRQGPCRAACHARASRREPSSMKLGALALQNLPQLCWASCDLGTGCARLAGGG